MSMIGVEVTKFINPDLTWKIASKGSRSASRRPRKLKTRNFIMGVKQAENSLRAEETSTSESEKLGVAVLGRRFYDKVEHVPIKKRKYLVRSPSPPLLTPSLPLREHSKELINSDKSPRQCTSPTSVSSKFSVKFSDCARDGGVDGNIVEETKGKPGYDEDFSGIDMLVAVACDDHVVGGGGSVKDVLDGEEIDASSFPPPSKEFVAVTNKSVHEDDLSCSDLRLFNFSASNSVKTQVSSDSMHLDRSHWDLNTHMDSWEEPCANLNGDLQADTVATVLGDEADFKTQVKLENVEIISSKEFTEGRVLSLAQSGVSNKDVSNITSKAEYVAETPLKTVVLPCSARVECADACRDFSINSGSKSPKMILMPKENYSCTRCPDAVKKKDCVSGLNLDQSKLNLDFKLATVSDKTICACIGNDEIEGCCTSEIISPMFISEKSQSPDCGTYKIENGATKSGVVTTLPHSSRFVDLSPLVPLIPEEKTVVNSQEKNALEVDNYGGLDSPTPCDHKDFSEKWFPYSTAAFGEFPLNGPFTSSNSDIPPDLSKKSSCLQELKGSQKNHLVDMEKLSVVQEGYDSQFEDGELRESVVQCLKDIEGDDCEAEQVDYDESDDRDINDIADDTNRSFSFGACMRESSPATSLIVESNEKIWAKSYKIMLTDTSKRNNNDFEIDTEDRRRSVDGIEPSSPKEDPSLEENLNSKWCGWDHGCGGGSLKTKNVGDGRDFDGGSVVVVPPPLGVSTTTTTKVMEGRTGNDLVARDVKNVTGTRVVDLRESGRVMPSCNEEGGSSYNLLPRSCSDRVQLRRLGDHGKLCGEDERERGNYGSGRGMRGGRGRYYSSQMRGRGGRVRHRIDNHMWNSRPRDNSFRYDNPYDSRKQGVKYDAKVEDGMYYSRGGGGVDRPFVRRSPIEVHDDDYDGSRSGRYIQKNGFPRQLPQAPLGCNLSQRERSFSPMFSRGDASGFRYGSRSRSPHSILQREHNAAFSSDFRVEGRIDRPPIRKAEYESDYEAEFIMSPVPLPRRRLSPKHGNNSRWADERNRQQQSQQRRGVDDFRNRRSPGGGRVFNRFGGDDYYNRGRFEKGNASVSDPHARRKAARYPQQLQRQQHGMFLRRCGSSDGVDVDVDDARRFQYNDNNDEDQQLENSDNNKDECFQKRQQRYRNRGGTMEGGFSDW